MSTDTLRLNTSETAVVHPFTRLLEGNTKGLNFVRATVLLLVVSIIGSGVRAADLSTADWELLKKEIEDLRKDNADIKKTNAELATKLAPTKGTVDQALDNKYGPGAPVTTKTGKLNISYLLQIWYYSPQKDNNALFQDPNVNGIADTNEAINNDTFRIRRSEMRFTFDINEHIVGEIMIDPAREAQSFPSLPDNQANSSIFKRLTNTNVANVQTGAGSAPRLLQDAWIGYRDLIPHHDFRIGQFKPPFGEEGIRSSAQLDFVERSFVGQLGENRDQGITAHGEWWGADGKGGGRFQYWLGAFNAPGNFYQSAGQYQNRSDDNDAKDFIYRIFVRPLWKNTAFGSLELGFSQQFGRHGESGGTDPIDSPVNALNRRRTWANRMDAWGYYAPGSFLRGMWVRGEWEWQKDRNAPQQVIDLLAQGNAGDGSTQTNGKPFVSQGYYIATGYRFADSALFTCECPRWYHNLEFAFRYETYQNVEVADLVNPSHTDVFKSSVFTGGVNYYISGNTKIQANYNVLHNPEVNSANRVFHNARDNAFVVNFQVAF
jgi:phosphate-selective porin